MRTPLYVYYSANEASPAMGFGESLKILDTRQLEDATVRDKRAILTNSVPNSYHFDCDIKS